MTGRSRPAAAALLVLAVAWPARAEGPSRGLGWGPSLVVPVLATEVRATDGTALALTAAGGGVEGRVGLEAGPGLWLGGLAGVSAHASENTRGLVLVRVEVEGRWTADTGGPLAPFLELGAGLLLAQLPTAIQPTACARLGGGAALRLAPWVELDLAVAFEGAVPGAAFSDAIAWVTPRFGATFFE